MKKNFDPIKCFFWVSGIMVGLTNASMIIMKIAIPYNQELFADMATVIVLVIMIVYVLAIVIIARLANKWDQKHKEELLSYIDTNEFY